MTVTVIIAEAVFRGIIPPFAIPDYSNLLLLRHFLTDYDHLSRL